MLIAAKLFRDNSRIANAIKIPKIEYSSIIPSGLADKVLLPYSEN